MWPKLSLFTSLLTLTAAAPQSSSYRVASAPSAPITTSFTPSPSAPVYTSSPTTAFSNPRPAYDYPDVRPKYSFEYAVSDFSNNFGHSESRDGHKTTGTYRVLLPDSRTQIVTYTADENGYVADVRYEGQAVYPTEFKPVFGTESGPAYPDTTAPAPRPSHISSTVYRPATVQSFKSAPNTYNKI